MGGHLEFLLRRMEVWSSPAEERVGSTILDVSISKDG